MEYSREPFTGNFHFGPFLLKKSVEVFYVSKLSYGIVNLKPIVPGHVLVIPKRVVKRFKELDLNEVYDLWHSAQLIGGRLEQYYHVQAMTYCVQDGEAAGQTVPHVHVHVIPRRAGDFERNDQVYEMLEASSSYLHGSRKWEIDTEERRVRTEEEMEEETKLLRTLFM
ncbi:bis(5'-adenosyl)-triphosphatase [Galdieria sulphuraria]|uniref:Bis(5'-adenosyl)-triphosphatase n=1 Tax=Galdieria sulphuraria TaxID=130081 RepID=M2XWR1_GALSU|nr:bis(5'-adenosyl)-triphosphatase [Galdieria sulphuraria]EME28068.1 bis(5'-adenosyl)-triphosphatase [Galdieria sulphuraria]|eukprot:XP_005704588.1 bis(5'-adenosyl)-triphosphatase [Galdieria sulphuraria]